MEADVRFPHARRFGLLLATAPQVVLAQSLNDAVTAQLASDNGLPPNPCGLLLAGDSASVLGNDGLNDICTRDIEQSGPAMSFSEGGGAATPPSRPVVVEARLKEEEQEAGATPRGLFFMLGEDSIDRSPSTFEAGYQSDVQRIAAGMDRIVGDVWIAGIALDISEQDGAFVDGFGFEIDNVGVTAYGSRAMRGNSALDFYFGFSQHANERQRRALFQETSGDPLSKLTNSYPGAPQADFDADQLATGIQYSRDWVRDNATFGPRLGFDWSRTSYDTYAEVDDSGLALTFYEDDETSAQFSLGQVGTLALSTNSGVVVIHEYLAYRYEIDQDQRIGEVSFVEDTRAKRFTYQTEGPDRDFLEFAVGVTFILRNGLQILTEYGGITSHKFLDTNSLVVGFRKEL